MGSLPLHPANRLLPEGGRSFHLSVAWGAAGVVCQCHGKGSKTRSKGTQPLLYSSRPPCSSVPDQPLGTQPADPQAPSSLTPTGSFILGTHRTHGGSGRSFQQAPLGSSVEHPEDCPSSPRGLQLKGWGGSPPLCWTSSPALAVLPRKAALGLAAAPAAEQAHSWPGLSAAALLSVASEVQGPQQPCSPGGRPSSTKC